MLTTAYKKIIIVLLLLAFTSQTMASAAMKCQLEEASHNKPVMMDMNAMDHNDPGMEHMHHTMNEMVANDAGSPAHQTSDCCKTMGHCLFGCAVIAVSDDFTFLLKKINVGIDDLYSSTTSSHVIPSLYRPPISA